MKKFYPLPLLTLILLFANLKNANATHVVGSETTWKYLGNDTFLIKLVAYGKCTDGGSTLFNPGLLITSDSCATYYNISPGSQTSYSVEDITPLCATQQKPCAISGGSGQSTPQIPIGVIQYTWTFKVFFGGAYANCCWYKLHWQLCCRSSNISTGPANQDYINDAWLNRCVANSSPQFTNQPIIMRCTGQDVVHNMGAQDADHDSLSYRLAPLLVGSYTSPWSYNYPFTCLGGNNPNINTTPPIGFNLDSSNGNIFFRPMQVQSSVIKVEVLEWRKINGNYKLIGITSRDNQVVIIQNCNNKLPSISGPLRYEFCAGQNYCLTLNSIDQDNADTTRIYSNLTSVIPNATLTLTHDTIIKATATMCWTPVDSNIRSFPYYFNIVVEDNHCPLKGNTSRSIAIKVSATPKYNTSIKVLSGNTWKFEATPSGSFNNISYQWYVPTLVGQSLSNQVLVIAPSTNYTFTLNGKYIIRSRMYNNSVCYTEHFDTIDVDCATPLQIISSKDTFICLGGQVVLSTAINSTIAPYSYRWYANGILIDTVQTITHAPIANTLYRVVVISGDTCRLTAVDTINVLVDTSTLQILPFADLRICKGASVNLKPTFLGTKAQNYYYWYFNGLKIDSGLVFNHQPNIPGEYVYEVRSYSNCPAMIRDTFQLSFDTNMLSISSITDQVICEGNTVNLSPSILSGKLPFDYTWYENGIEISKAALLSIKPTTVSTFILKIVSQDSCYNIVYDTVNVSFFPKTLQLKLPNDTTICANTPFTLNAQVSGGSSYNYNWCPQGKTCSALPSPVYTFNTSTQIILDISSNTSCLETKRDTMMVHVFPVKQIIISSTNTTIIKGQTSVIKVSNGNNFSWMGNDIQTNWGDSILVKPSANTTYKAIGINANGCVDTSEITILVNNVGINKSSNDKNKLLIYPNPAKDELVIGCKLNEIESPQFIITNSLSQILIEGQLINDDTTIDIHSLFPGIYFIKVGNMVYKFVKN